MAAYVATRPPPAVQVAATTNVVVQLQGLAGPLADPAVVVILLDGRPVTREELGRPVSLQPGEHALEMRRGDGTVVRTHTFAVGRGDDGGQVPIPASCHPVRGACIIIMNFTWSVSLSFASVSIA